MWTSSNSCALHAYHYACRPCDAAVAIDCGPAQAGAGVAGGGGRQAGGRGVPALFARAVGGGRRGRAQRQRLPHRRAAKTGAAAGGCGGAPAGWPCPGARRGAAAVQAAGGCGHHVAPPWLARASQETEGCPSRVCAQCMHRDTRDCNIIVQRYARNLSQAHWCILVILVLILAASLCNGKTWPTLKSAK